MAKLYDFDKSKVSKPPNGEPWVWHTRKLMESPAWRARSIHCVRLLEFLEIEHLAHGGAENGYLIATYDQLEQAGIGRRYISATIIEAERLGLLEAHRGARKSATESHVSAFRLTYYASKTFDPNGNRHYVAPTNDWKRVTKERATAIQADIRALKHGGKTERVCRKVH